MLTIIVFRLLSSDFRYQLIVFRLGGYNMDTHGRRGYDHHQRRKETRGTHAIASGE